MFRFLKSLQYLLNLVSWLQICLLISIAVYETMRSEHLKQMDLDAISCMFSARSSLSYIALPFSEKPHKKVKRADFFEKWRVFLLPFSNVFRYAPNN